MHAVFHPVNGVLIQALATTVPLWAMGYGPQAVAMFFMINGMHGLISHFNVDVRMGLPARERFGQVLALPFQRNWGAAQSGAESNLRSRRSRMHQAARGQRRCRSSITKAWVWWTPCSAK